MKNRASLMVVAKGGVFGSGVMRRKLPKMLPWSHYPARLFYIMTSYSSWLSKKTITRSDMNYKAALCKAAWEKKLLAQVAERTGFCSKNCDSNFFMRCPFYGLTSWIFSDIFHCFSLYFTHRFYSFGKYPIINFRFLEIYFFSIFVMWHTIGIS